MASSSSASVSETRTAIRTDRVNTPSTESSVVEEIVEHVVEHVVTVTVDHMVITQPSPIVWILVCAGLYLGALLYGLDTTIAADVQGPVYESLGEIEKLPWIGIGFPMGSVAVILLFVKLYSLFEIKYLIIASITLFEAGSALCGAAPTANALIVGRVFAGVGGAGMYLGALTYISVFTSIRRQPIYNAMIGLAWGTGAILGPVIAGVFAESKATWRWAFYINLPLAALMAPVYVFLLPRYDPCPDLYTSTKLLHIDWLGAILNAVTFVLFMVVVSFSGSTFEWSSAASITIWTIFGIALILYVIQQYFCLVTTHQDRLFPAHFLRSRTFILLYLSTSASAGAVAVCIYYIPLFFQFTRGDSALEAAVRVLPFITLFVTFVMIAGFLLPVVRLYAPWYFPAASLILIGASLMHGVNAHTPISAIYGYEVLIAVGIGLVFQTGYTVAAALVAPEDVMNTIGFINVAQIGSIAIALSISGALFQNLGFAYLKDALGQYGIEGGALRSALAGIESMVLENKGVNVRDIAVDAIVQTIGQIYTLVIAAGGVIFVCVCWMKMEALNFDRVE